MKEGIRIKRNFLIDFPPFWFVWYKKKVSKKNQNELFGKYNIDFYETNVDSKASRKWLEEFSFSIKDWKEKIEKDKIYFFTKFAINYNGISLAFLLTMQNYENFEKIQIKTKIAEKNIMEKDTVFKNLLITFINRSFSAIQSA